MKQDEIAGLTTTEPGKTFEELMVAIRDNLKDLASSYDAEDGEDEDVKEREHGKVCEYGEPGWVLGTISKCYSSA
jgi:hypothetical protein